MFDNRKIKQIRKLPEGDAIIGIWVQILCLAGQVNDSGMIYFSKDIPYTEEMLAVEFDRPINLIRIALKTLTYFKMIEIHNNILLVSNWEKYQSADKLEQIREQNRIRQRKYREKQKLLDSNVTVTLPVTQSNAVDIDIDIEEERDKEYIPYQEVVDFYNQICTDLPKVQKLTDKRKRTIKARWKDYDNLDTYKQVFQKAEESDFLSGRNGKWTSCNFDWLLNENNMIKVLEGNYENKGGGPDGPADKKTPKFDKSKFLYQG